MNKIFYLLVTAILILSCDKNESNTNNIDSLDLTDPTIWKISSTPARFTESALINDLAYGYNRAKMAWYSIDPMFLRNTSTTPNHIKYDLDQLSSHFVREVYENELFPDMYAAYGTLKALDVLNIAFYPNERGPYNFDSENINLNGELTTPTQRWGGIVSQIVSSNFNSYIEFWLMDPFIENNSSSNGGDLYINLGIISEDILKDSKKSFEQGLRIPGELNNNDTTKWGIVSKKNNSSGIFVSSPSGQLAQDVGLDGLNSYEELNFFSEYINQMKLKVSSETYESIVKDPSCDDYHYYRGSDYDASQLSLLERYKNFNNTESNSIPLEFSPEYYSTAAYYYPDNEDLDRNNELNCEDSYREYHISLRPNDLTIGENFIIDKITRIISLINGTRDEINWYHFNIPIENYSYSIGNVGSIEQNKFIRLYLTNFEGPIILRLVEIKIK